MPMASVVNNGISQADRTSHMKCDSTKRTPQMVRIPHFSKAWQVVSDCQYYNSEDVATAMVVFYISWKGEFGDPNLVVWHAMNNLFVDWGEQLRPLKRGYDVDGNLVTDGRARGLVLSKSSIWVWITMTNRISGTAFVHELVHVSIRAKNGKHGDADHEGTKYEGWTSRHTEFIKKTNNILDSFNL